MQSNTPNSGKSSSSNALPTHTNPSITPSDVREVSQLQSSQPLLDNADSIPDHQHLLDSLPIDTPNKITSFPLSSLPLIRNNLHNSKIEWYHRLAMYLSQLLDT